VDLRPLEPRRFDVVTTCHRAGYDDYGRDMVDSWQRFWPETARLLVYSEGFQPPPVTERVGWRDLEAACPELVAFKQRHRDDPVAHGARPRPVWRLRIEPRKLRFKIRRKTAGQGFRWNAVRFSHKVFAMADAGRRSQADVLVWLDADILTHAPVPHELLESLVPRDAMLGFLDRPGWGNYTETGLLAFNLRHPRTRGFLGDWCRFYVTDAVFREREWHDCWLFDIVRRRYQRRGVRTFDIAGGRGRRAHDVFRESPAGRYMSHLKGRRKSAAREPGEPVATGG